MQVALRWFCSRSLLRQQGLSKELVDRIPGKQTDRKTPLGELNWIFTAITDTIAWNLLPRVLFQRLFRQVRLAVAAAAAGGAEGWHSDPGLACPPALSGHQPNHANATIIRATHQLLVFASVSKSAASTRT